MSLDWDKERPRKNPHLIFTCRLKAGPGGNKITFDGKVVETQLPDFRFFQPILPGHGIYHSIQEGLKRINPEELGTIAVSQPD